MKWLNSLDELLYEIMSWLLFFPLTLWRSVVSPMSVMEEVGRQAALPDERRYEALLSPPLFLALALLLGHRLSTALGQTDAIIASQHGLASLVDDNASALVLRVIVFAAFPLFLAARIVRFNGGRLTRQTLRQPFYEQCYPAAVSALGLTLGTSLVQLANEVAQIGGIVLIILASLAFWLIETRWFSRALGTGLIRSACNVLIGLAQGMLFLMIVGFLFAA